MLSFLITELNYGNFIVLICRKICACRCFMYDDGFFELNLNGLGNVAATKADCEAVISAAVMLKCSCATASTP